MPFRSKLSTINALALKPSPIDESSSRRNWKKKQLPPQLPRVTRERQAIQVQQSALISYQTAMVFFTSTLQLSSAESSDTNKVKAGIAAALGVSYAFSLGGGNKYG